MTVRKDFFSISYIDDYIWILKMRSFSPIEITERQTCLRRDGTHDLLPNKFLKAYQIYQFFLKLKFIGFEHVDFRATIPDK